MRKLTRKTIGITIASASLFGCGGVGEIERSTETTFPEQEEVVAQKSNGNWSVTCYGPTKERAAKVGDTLLTMIYANTDVRNSASLDTPNIPLDVLVEVVGDLNGLENPDKINSDEEYLFPDFCQPDIIK